MSTLIVKVVLIDEIKPHPNADKLCIACIGEWETIVKYDPMTATPEFSKGQKVIFIPPDVILPPTLANGPTDNPPGRLNCKGYLKPVPADENGVVRGKVSACNLRGVPSFGLICPILPTDPEWQVGDDVAEHFGIVKYEPPPVSQDGDAEADHPRFHKFSDIEGYQNFSHEFVEGEEVVITEKCHGSNSRLALVLDAAQWEFMGGSHDVRRKEYYQQTRRFRDDDFTEIFNEDEQYQLISSPTSFVGKVIDRKWKVEEFSIRHSTNTIHTVEGMKVESQMARSLRTVECDKDGKTVVRHSKYWKGMTNNVRELLNYVKDEVPFSGIKNSIMVFGEVYGSQIQDMDYGIEGVDFMAFDLAINNCYLDFDVKKELFDKFNVKMVPILYRGPYSREIVKLYTDGETTISDKIRIKSKFKGREGIVILPVKERGYGRYNRRLCLKSVSAAYHARKGGTEFH